MFMVMVYGSSILKFCRALYEKIIFLEQKTREQDIIIANMSEQISSYNLSVMKLHQRYCNGCYLWYFSDFKGKVNAMRENPHIMHYSPGFYTSANGYRYVLFSYYRLIVL